jgi:hypothetical protein
MSFAVRVGYRNDGRLLLLERCLHDDVDDSLRILVVDSNSALHLLSRLAIRRPCAESFAQLRPHLLLQEIQ